MKHSYKENSYKVDVNSFYHPVASVIVNCVEKRINFINRGLFEVKNLQSENFTAEKFAITTETRLLEGFLRDFFYLQKDVSVLVPPLGTSISNSIKVYSSEKEAKYRLIFKPIDSLNNFAKGFAECGCYFVLQSILPEDTRGVKYENVFSLFYSFKAQKFLYAEHKGIVYLENKRMKAMHRKSSLTVSINSNAILNNLAKPVNLQNAKVKHVFSRGEGLVSDCFDLANGALDGIIYNQIKGYELLPIQILLSSLTCYSSLKYNSEFFDNLEKETDIIAGTEVLVKAFN